MLRQIERLRVGLVLLLGILLFCSGTVAMAEDNRGDNRGIQGKTIEGTPARQALLPRWQGGINMIRQGMKFPLPISLLERLE